MSLNKDEQYRSFYCKRGKQDIVKRTVSAPQLMHGSRHKLHLDFSLNDMVDTFLEDDFIDSPTSVDSHVSSFSSHTGVEHSNEIEHSNELQHSNEIEHSVRNVPTMYSTEDLIVQLNHLDRNVDMLQYDGNVVLKVVGNFVFGAYDYFTEFNGIKNNMDLFWMHVNERYHDMPYHNIHHASDVLYNTYLLVVDLQLNVISRLELYVLYLAAVLHDVEHFGKSNRYLELSQHELSFKYENSPLESMHIDTAKSILRNAQFQLLAKLNPSQMERVYQQLELLIYGTDLKNQKQLIHDFHVHHAPLALVLHAADLGASTKDIEIHRQWATRINEEFAVEQKLLDGNANALKIKESQIGFLVYIALPVYQALEKDPNLPSVQKYIDGIQGNIQYWQSQTDN